MSQDAGGRLRKAMPWALAAMPGYTVGILAPVPFFVAALRHQVRKLWLFVAVYGAVWITAWILAAVGRDGALGTLSGFVFIGLAIAGTTHAFVLREWLPGSSPRPGVIEAPVAGFGSDPTKVTCAQLQAALSSLTPYTASHAESFPATCKRLLDETIAQMEQVISFVARDGHADAELRSVQAMLTDYLPTSLTTYLRLPREYALTQRNPDGRTAAEELEMQLQLLRDNAAEAAGSLYRGDALRLQEQSAFLQAKFGKSELDLDR